MPDLIWSAFAQFKGGRESVDLVLQDIRNRFAEWVSGRGATNIAVDIISSTVKFQKGKLRYTLSVIYADGIGFVFESEKMVKSEWSMNTMINSIALAIAFSLGFMIPLILLPPSLIIALIAFPLTAVFFVAFNFLAKKVGLLKPKPKEELKPEDAEDATLPADVLAFLEKQCVMEGLDWKGKC